MGDRATRTRPIRALPATKRRPRLLIEQGALAPRTIELDRESAIVGRVVDADVRLDVDGVSRKHARITRVGQALNLVDLGSKNGTFVNGERIDVAALHHGDRLQLGPVTLRYVLAEEGQPASTPTGAVLPTARLSPRERQVAEHVALGMTNVEIAAALGITRRTVATHLERVYERLGIHSRAALANLVGRGEDGGSG
ncbi:MAG: FHA domain-containing protein [Deltaproteobacteria bacterium]|nr:FHA domain-containing protein [Deltaproteobacteria bacterium]